MSDVSDYEDDEDICPRCGEPLDWTDEDDPDFDPDEAIDHDFGVHERCVTGDEYEQRLKVLAKLLADKQSEAG